MRRGALLWPLMLVLSACGHEDSTTIETIRYTIDADRVTLSGLSAGAYMAGQLHVAHSSLFRGAGLIAGGPYYCAEGSVQKGIGPCVKGGDIELGRLVAYADEMMAAGKIDDTANLSGHPVWLFHGTLDTTVNESLTRNAIAMYTALAGDVAGRIVDDIAVVHGMPTLETGAACDTFATPYVNACGYDAAGEVLKAMYGELETRVDAVGELRTILQPGFDDAGMLEHAFVYVPGSCAAGEVCGIHVVLHGCNQSTEFVGDAFVAGAGYNEWAEANRLLVLYPQAASSKIAPMNPYGCWDWWGYTDADYATKDGAQIGVIKAMLDSLAGQTL